MDFWQAKVERDRYEQLLKDLGILWSREEVQAAQAEKEQGQRKVPDHLRIPLTVAIAPEIEESVRKSFGRKLGILPPKWAKTDEIVDLFDTDKEEFLAFVRNFVRPKVVGR